MGDVISTSIDNRKLDKSHKNNTKLVKSKKYNFTKIMYKTEETSFQILNTKQIFSQLR